ncbi:MAG: HAD family hydrolase [Candidatus Eisenbacteria bacterium]|jgi:phosphoglycolate phosphatase-like HAD superfamily hydrolase|nr:HAD family hydrolase [Candidatus Eisenbacteria bacterium]
MKSGLLIFDLDGTLFRSETVTVPAVQRAFREHGLVEPSAPEICWFFGKPHRDFQEWLESIVPGSLASGILAAVDRRELELVSETGELYAGVAEMLTEARKQFTHLAICTNGEREYVARVLSTSGLLPFFDRIRYRESPVDTKAAMVAELLSTLDARPAFVIGDRSEDIDAAHANGILAIGARYGYGTVGELATADATIQTPLSLLEVLSFMMLPRKFPGP